MMRGKHGASSLHSCKDLLDAFEALRGHAVGEDVEDLGASVGIFHGDDEELFAGTLIERDGVEFVGGDAPPAGKDCADDEIGHELFPDEGLHVFGSDEVLLGGGEGVGEIGERAHEVSAAAGWRADSEEHGGLPELFGADDGDLGEVVRAHEERIVVKDLRAGRLVVGVVEADESVAKEGSELAAGCFELGRVPGALMTLVRSVWT